MELLDLPMHRRLFETERDRQLIYWGVMALNGPSYPDYASLHKRISALFDIDEEKLRLELLAYVNSQSRP